MWHQMVEQELRELLAVPDDVALSACITLGRPQARTGRFGGGRCTRWSSRINGAALPTGRSTRPTHSTSRARVGGDERLHAPP